MAQSYSDIENRTITIQRETKTLSFRPTVVMADRQHFMQILSDDTKVCLNLYDFTKGKGDDAVNVYFNLDLADVEYLYEHAKLSSLQMPYEKSKFYGAYPEKEGPHKGFCRNHRISIKREPFYADRETGEKKVAANPWMIRIETGYAEPQKNQKGMYFPKKGTAVWERKSNIALTDIEFLAAFSKTMRYINMMAGMAAPMLIKDGLEALEKQNERGSYTGDAEQNKKKSETTEQKNTSKGSPTNVFFVSLKKDTATGLMCGIGRIMNKEYELVFDSFGDEHKEAYRNKREISLNIYKGDDGRLHCQ